MDPLASFHVVTVGWLRELGEPIAERAGIRLSYIAHPRHTREEFPMGPCRGEVRYLRERLCQLMPEPDTELLASLEQEGVPTMQNIILGDRVVAKLEHRSALGYLTFLARRMAELYAELQPSAVIASFDGVHSGISLAVARRMRIPWFAMNFSVIPPGLACFVDAMSPNARVHVARRPLSETRALAEDALARFEQKRVNVPAFVTPPALSIGQALKRIPARLAAVRRTRANARMHEYLQFTEERSDLSVRAALRHLRNVRAARRALSKIAMVRTPPTTPYLFFGLHTQPESAIDVWAPFFANQQWVIELLSRSLPATHKLLVKIHKSDAANYTAEQLDRIRSNPGVELVLPFADTRAFVERADMILSIQGTMGLEGALLGKPVIMLGDSPATMFPSVSRIGELSELPALIKKRLNEPPPLRSAILDAYTEYLAPFLPAAHNDWSVSKSSAELDNIAALFRQLGEHVRARPAAA